MHTWRLEGLRGEEQEGRSGEKGAGGTEEKEEVKEREGGGREEKSVLLLELIPEMWKLGPGKGI